MASSFLFLTFLNHTTEHPLKHTRHPPHPHGLATGIALLFRCHHGLAAFPSEARHRGAASAISQEVGEAKHISRVRHGHQTTMGYV